MGYGRIRRWPPSRRDQKIAIKNSLDFMARAADKPSITAPGGPLEITIPPKRERIRRTVDNKPVGQTEHQAQRTVIDWWARFHNRYQLPEFALFAVPNGGARDAITGAMLKAEGVRRGALDLILAKPTKQYAGLFIEMKVGDNKPSDEQKAFLEYLLSVGYKAVVHWSADSAISEIKSYLADDLVIPAAA